MRPKALPFEDDETNLKGPSMIRVPDWLPNPLGRYTLYVAHHKSAFLRLACADMPTGPFHVHDALIAPRHLAMRNPDDIASPDVHVDHDRNVISMYCDGRFADQSKPATVFFAQYDMVPWDVEPLP